MARKTKTVTVIGAGTWGITLGNLLHSKKHQVRFWDASETYVRILRKDRQNRKGLPGVKIARSVPITASMAEAVEDADVLLVVSPSHLVRRAAEEIRATGCRPAMVVVATKGIENRTLLRMSEVVRQAAGLPRRIPVVTLSGPSHAEEVSRNIPTAVVAACPSAAAARATQELFITPQFRVYTNRDQVGVELAGSLKNVIALAAGICDGLKLGDNTKGALITRGLAEMSRLGRAMGARAETFAGLAGIGDLITTCASQHSRNRFVGEQIGKGKTLGNVLDGMVEVAEGVKMTVSGMQLTGKYGVDMPITRQIYSVLYRNKKPGRAVDDLMRRAAKPEDR